MVRLGWTILAVVLVCPALVTAVPYGSECAESTDCDGTLRCREFFWDLSARMLKGNATLVKKGLCVECDDECDCGVNQYCGIDVDSPVTIPSFALETSNAAEFPYLSSHVDQISSGVQGMAIASKCLDYDTGGKLCPLNTDWRAHIVDKSPIKYKDATGNNYNPFKLVTWTLNHPTQDDPSYCGKINSWAPARRAWVGSPSKDEEDRALVDIAEGTPATCTKQVKAKIKGADECKFEGHFFTKERNSCDNTALDDMKCREACSPSGTFLAGTNCESGDDLQGDNKLFCDCLRACNTCVRLKGGCGVDDPTNPNGYCGECPSSTPPPPPPPPAEEKSPYTCAVEDPSSSPTPAEPEERTCKGGCRGCMVEAMKTACKCSDKTGTESDDATFGECRRSGRFVFSLQDASLTQGSRAANWYASNWNEPNVRPEVGGMYEYFRASGELAWIEVNSPAIAWQGYCDGSSTTCKVCDDSSVGASGSGSGGGSRGVRCEHKGIRQECRGGKWVKSENHIGVSPVVPGLPTETAPVIVCAIVLVIMTCIIVIITSCIWCVTMTRSVAKPAENAGTSSASAQIGNPNVSTPSPPIVSPPPPGMVCAGCGAARKPDNDFCASCGARYDSQV